MRTLRQDAQSQYVRKNLRGSHHHRMMMTVSLSCLLANGGTRFELHRVCSSCGSCRAGGSVTAKAQKPLALSSSTSLRSSMSSTGLESSPQVGSSLSKIRCVMCLTWVSADGVTDGRDVTDDGVGETDLELAEDVAPRAGSYATFSRGCPQAG